MVENDAETAPILSKNQRRALVAMLRCPTIAAAAREVGLGETTLWRYLRDPVFAEALIERQRIVLKTTTTALVGLSELANEALYEILSDTEAPASVRARVALGIWQHRQDAVELVLLEERLAALEERLTEGAR